MIVYKAFKVRIYPDKQQQWQIDNTLGGCRAIYNMMLYERKQIYEQLKDDKRKLYEYKYKTEKEYKKEFEWLKISDSQALQQARVNLSNAYSNFFKSLKGQRKGEKSGFPKFKKKKAGSSYRTTMTSNKTIEINNEIRKIKLPKTGWIKFRNGRTSPKGGIKSATISRTPTGKYYVSVLIECEIEPKDVVITENSKIKGLDMSLASFYVDECGESPKYLQVFRSYEKKLAKYQRQLFKKKLYSKNWYKANRKVNLIYEQIKDQRNDFTQKLSKKLVNGNDIIVVETLSLKGMSQALNLGKSIMDLGYSEFIRQLKYKSFWQGKVLIEADKWFASSKTCNVCGYYKKDLHLSDRSWICPKCATVHNRDENAAVNLIDYGLVLLGLAKSDFKPVEKGVLKDSSVKQEYVSDVTDI